MPVEVRQLVVRGEIQGAAEPDKRDDPTVVDLDEMKAEILESCRRMVEELLRESRER